MKINIGDIVEYNLLANQASFETWDLPPLVRVLWKFKHKGRAAFYGALIEDGSEAWGYTTDIRSVVTA
jgi:hypothetical protein